MGRLRPIILAASILISHQASAQTQFNMLHGASKIRILVENMDDANEKECGLTREAVLGAIKYPLSSSKIEIVGTEVQQTGKVDKLEVTLSVTVLTLASNKICVSAIRLNAVYFQRVKLEFSGDTKTAVVLLWEGSDVVRGPRTGYSQQVSEAIEGNIKKFVADWNLDNR